MDPLTAASTLATIVQLLGIYKQEHKDSKETTHREFIEWLEHHRHEEIKNLICSNGALQTEVLNVLRQDTTAVLSKLDSVNATMAAFLSQIDGLKGLATTLMPSTQLSDQAISVLRQLLASGGRSLIYGELLEGAVVLQPEGGDPLEYTEPLFLSDDLDSLVRTGLFAQLPSGEGYSRYRVTRAGAKYIELLGSQSLSSKTTS